MAVNLKVPGEHGYPLVEYLPQPSGAELLQQRPAPENTLDTKILWNKVWCVGNRVDGAMEYQTETELGTLWRRGCGRSHQKP